MTCDINDWYSITVFHGEEEVGAKRWRARAHVFRRDRPDMPDNRVGEFVGVGTTMNSADYDARRQAKRFVLSQGKPLDWEGR